MKEEEIEKLRKYLSECEAKQASQEKAVKTQQKRLLESYEQSNSEINSLQKIITQLQQQVILFL